jgi:hypothetical protein
VDQSDFIRKVRGEASRYCQSRPDYFHEKTMQHRIENVVNAFLCNNQSIVYKPQFISLCGPLILVFDSEITAYLALGRILDKISIFSLI